MRSPPATAPGRGRWGLALATILGGATLFAWAVADAGGSWIAFTIFAGLLLLYGAPLWITLAHELGHQRGEPSPIPSVRPERRRLTSDLYGILGSFDHGVCLDHLPVGTPVLLHAGSRGATLEASDRVYPLDPDLLARVLERSVAEPAIHGSQTAPTIRVLPLSNDEILRPAA